MEKNSVRKWYFNVLTVLLVFVFFGWNQVKYARIGITHVCFIALTLAGSLRRCLNTRLKGPHVHTASSGNGKC